MGTWPFPKENTTIRARKMALAYRHAAGELAGELAQIRAALAEVDPRILMWIDDQAVRETLSNARKPAAGDVVGALDQRFLDWGESWHTDTPVTYDEDEWVAGRVAAKLIHVGPNSIRRYRLEGRLPAEWRKVPGCNANGWWYRVGDLYKLRETLPGRGWRGKGVKDTVGDNGRSDTE